MQKSAPNPTVETESQTGGRTLSRLAKSRSGNTFVILAAAFVPMAAFVGAGFDMSRSYLVKSRLQTACDSGALAARRAMSGSGWGTASQAAADSYFDANFQSGRFGTTGLARSFTSVDSEIVQGVASADVPTTIMKMFGNDVVKVDVNCQAIMNLPNTDVMFVLDTTGSMDQTNPGDPTSKIVALRNSVQNFHDTLEGAKSSGVQVRYGYVPYSTNVNVGHLLKRDWMVDDWTYQSRIPDSSAGMVTTYDWPRISGTLTWTVTHPPLGACNKPANTEVYTNGTTPVVTVSGSTTVTTDQYTINGIRYYLEKTDHSCTLTAGLFTNYVEQRVQTVKPATTGTDFFWNYRPVEYDVSSLKGSNSDGTMAGGSITAPVGHNFAPTSVTWNGCIEERATVRTDDYSPIPATARDLDIDAVPVAGEPATQWRPALSGLVFYRYWPGDWHMDPVRTTDEYDNLAEYAGGVYAACPTAARKLAPMSNGETTTYLDSLTTDGNTYHDIGMIWGLRLMSATGLFAAENVKTPSGQGIVRHLIFMTDGDTNTDNLDYDAYGLAGLDRRRTDPASVPTEPDTVEIVENRLAALCEDAKDHRNITIWVIAFGTTLTPLLENCASPGNAFEANNAPSLNSTFAEIASKIANLRLKN
jgi:Flp pilus assembly protein TadG